MSVYCKTIEDALIAVRKHEEEIACTYIFYWSDKEFSVSNVSPTPTMRLHFDNEGIPYFQFGGRTYICHQGKDINVYQKDKNAENRDKKAMCDFNFTRRYNVKRETKKRNCKAQIHMKRILLLRNYKLHNALSRYEKLKTSKLIKSLLREKGIIEGEDCITFSFPGNDAHTNHLIGEDAKYSECLDYRVRKKIEELVKEGKRSVQIIQEFIQDFVQNTLQVEETDLDRRRYKPEQKLIRAIIKRVKMKLRWSKLDQENVKLMTEKWDKNDCQFFFRPFVKNDISDSETNNSESHLLFVFQNYEMQRLYALYGSNSVLLDATYKTCKYALPLYFLMVKTNINYQVVAVFITQFETTESIEEALTVIKKWNPNIHPKYGMVDYAVEEIKALEEVFTGIQVFICTFHREQAWTRWLSKRENNCSNIVQFKKISLVYLRTIANALSEEELLVAIQHLSVWEHYTHLKSYFETTWKPEIKRWALAYKPHDLFFDTNNGVERTNEELKYRYLLGYKQCSLSEIIQVVVKKFIPERYRVYCTENVQMSSLYRTYSRDIPHYLHNRPAWFIDYVQMRRSSAEDNDQVKVTVLGDNEFQISSFTNEKASYKVSILKDEELCKCTCKDYKRYRIICKHIVLVGLKHQQWSLDKISPWIFNNPIFLIDLTCAARNSEPPKMENLKTSTEDEKMEKTTSHDKNEFNHDSITSEQNFDDKQNELQVPQKCRLLSLSLRGRKKKHLIMEGQSRIRTLQSLLYLLPIEHLQQFTEDIKNLTSEYQTKVSSLDNGLPCEEKEEKIVQTTSVAEMTPNYGKLKMHPKKGVIGRVGISADELRHAMRPIDINLSPHENCLAIQEYIDNTDTTHFEVTAPELAEENKENILPIVKSENKENILPIAKSENKENISPIANSENNVFVTPRINNSKNSDFQESLNVCKKTKKNLKWTPSFSTIKEDCSSKCELSDITINYAQKIISTQEKAKGFQDTVLGQLLQFKAGRDSIQILHTAENHWVTVRIFNHEKISVYDSADLPPSDSLVKQIASIASNNLTNSITIKYECVQMQSIGSNNCGVFAIAFALALAKGENPTKITFEETLMREHLKVGLQNGILTSFPRTKKRVCRAKGKTLTFKLYCKCRMPFFNKDKMNTKLQMAQCDKCQMWFHKKCEKIPETIFTKTNATFICKKCKNEK